MAALGTAVKRHVTNVEAPTLNPFVSRQQQQACYAKRAAGEAGSWDCDEWSHATTEKLPQRLSKRAKRKLAKNASKVNRGPINRLDPTRTLTMRKAFNAKLTGQFALLKERIVKLVAEDDAFGLRERFST